MKDKQTLFLMYIDVVSVVTLKGSRSKQPDLASGYMPVSHSTDRQLICGVIRQCFWYSKVSRTMS